VAAGFAFDDDAFERISFANDANGQRMNKRIDPYLLHPIVGNELKAFRIDRVAQRLRLGGGGAISLGSLLEFNPNALDIDGLFLPVPRDAFHPDMGEVAAKTAVALDEPARAALIAAASPPAPLPTTRTSVFARTGVSRDGSNISFIAFQLRCHAQFNVPPWLSKIFKDPDGQTNWPRVGAVIAAVAGAVWTVFTFVVERKEPKDK
jgi:hypothetical protein